MSIACHLNEASVSRLRKRCCD